MAWFLYRTIVSVKIFIKFQAKSVSNEFTSKKEDSLNYCVLLLNRFVKTVLKYLFDLQAVV